MLDENLPTFYLKPSPDHVNHHQAFYLTYRGSEPEPAYNLKHPDPTSPAGKNCYAAALFDSFNPAILYGEVLVRPEWTTPSVSQDDIRRNGGVAPPPQPILPQQFVIQLYNPDQQVIVKQQKAGGWGGAPTYTFSMPQQTFRLPSNSSLDRQLSDPAADITTPQVNFVWKRDGKLSKDLACYMTGKSTDPVKKKHKEPDIIVSIFQALREVTIYESNYQRIDIEDPKGLEVVLLLCAAVLKDVYFSPIREAFNVGDAPPQALRKHSSSLNMLSSNGMQRKPSPKQSVGHLAVPSAASAPNATSVPNTRPPPPTHINRPASRPAHAAASRPSESGNNQRRQSLPQLRATSTPNMRPPPADPRSQWEIDAETARLRSQQEAERRAKDERRRAQERADAVEAKRLKKQLDSEEKERRRKQAEVDKETERLRKKYGTVGQEITPAVPPRHSSTPRPATQPQQRHHHSYQQQPRPQQYPVQAPRPPPQHHHPPTMSGGAGPSGSHLGTPSFFASNGLPIRNGYVKPKRSFWGLGSSRDMDMGQNRSMVRKSSVMF